MLASPYSEVANATSKAPNSPEANTKIGENISLLCAYRDAGKGVNHGLFVG